MKCIFCGAEVKMNEACQYCGSVAEPEYYGKQREQERKTEPEERRTDAAGTYTVKSGDNLWAIAKRIYGKGSDYGKIVRLNEIKNPNLIYPGQVLWVSPAYELLDPEMKKVAAEIAKQYPCSTEYVARIIQANGFNQEETERYIKQELLPGWSL